MIPTSNTEAVGYENVSKLSTVVDPDRELPPYENVSKAIGTKVKTEATLDADKGCLRIVVREV